MTVKINTAAVAPSNPKQSIASRQPDNSAGPTPQSWNGTAMLGKSANRPPYFPTVMKARFNDRL